MVLAAAVANNKFGDDDDAQGVAGLDPIANGNLHRLRASTRGGFSGGRGRGGGNMGRAQPPMDHRNHTAGVSHYNPMYVVLDERLGATLLTASLGNLQLGLAIITTGVSGTRGTHTRSTPWLFRSSVLYSRPVVGV